MLRPLLRDADEPLRKRPPPRDIVAAIVAPDLMRIMARSFTLPDTHLFYLKRPAPMGALPRLRLLLQEGAADA